MVPNPYPVAPATLGDLDDLLPRVREFHGHFGFSWDGERKRGLLRDLLLHPDLGRIWLTRHGARVAGYAIVVFQFSLEFEGRIALLDEFYLAPDFRGRGHGRNLLSQVTRALDGEGIRVIRLELDRKHSQAGGLYARHRFKPDGREMWTRRPA